MKPRYTIEQRLIRVDKEGCAVEVVDTNATNATSDSLESMKDSLQWLGDQLNTAIYDQVMPKERLYDRASGEPLQGYEGSA